MRNGSTVAAIACCVAATTGVAAIYQCADAQGTPHFAQYPCGDNAQVMEINKPSVVTAPGLTDAEQHTLDRLSGEYARNRQEAARNRQSARRHHARERSRRADICAASRAALDKLRGQKRRGYALGEAGALRGKATRLRQQIDDNC